MAAELSTLEKLRRVADGAKRIRRLASTGDGSLGIELTRIASDIEYNVLELERDFAKISSPDPSPDK
jgi:hypothetical protein